MRRVEVLGGTTTAADGNFEELYGLRDGENNPVYFPDAENKLVAAATISTGNDSPNIVLQPCGSARARFLAQITASSPLLRAVPGHRMSSSPSSRQRFGVVKRIDDPVLQTQRIIQEKLSPHFVTIRAVSIANRGN
jgi:hypothetical protein